MDHHATEAIIMEGGGRRPCRRHLRWLNPVLFVLFLCVTSAGGVHAQSNNPPTVAKVIPDLFAKAGSVVIYSFPADTFTDSDEDSLTYNATLKDGSSLPEWLDFNIRHLILEGIPTSGDIGTYTIRVTADDGNGGTVSDEFDLTVEASAPEAVLSLGGPANAVEGDSGKRVLTYTASLSESPSENVVFKVCFTPFDLRVDLNADRDDSGSTSWQAGGDYRLLNAGTPTSSACTGNLIFLKGTSSLSKTISVEVRGDTDVERDEAFNATLELIVATQGALLGRNRHTHWILNDDHGDARMVISPSSLTITEGQNATLTVKLSEQPSGSGFQTKDVSVQLTNHMNHRNEETQTAYFPSKENPVLAVRPLKRTFTVSNYQTSQTFTVHALTNDASASTTHVLSLQATQKLFAGEDRNYRDVADNILVTVNKASPSATRPVVSITPAVDYAAETDSRSAKFTVSRTGPTTSALAVKLFVSEKTGGGQFFLENADKGLRLLLIPAGQSSATYTSPIKNDGVDEPNGEVRVLIRASGSYTIDGTAGKAYVPVLDNDGGSTPTVSIEAVESPVTEGEGAEFRIRRMGDQPTHALTVDLGVEEKDASAGDFVASTDEGRDKTVTIPAGQLSVTYTVPTQDDSVDEPDGPVSVWIRRNDSAYLRHEDDMSRIETTVTVQDNDGDGDNSAPSVANPIPDQNATVGTSFSYVVPANTFSDSDGDTLTYTATGEDDAGLTFDASSRTFSGIPAGGDAGTHEVTVTASDGNGNSVQDTFTITVSAGNSAPSVANPIPDQNATVGTSFSYVVPANTFSDSDGDTLTYTATGEDDAGLTFDASSRTFSGIPAGGDAGTHEVTVTASDGNGNSVQDTFTITVSAGNSAPSVANPIPDQNATVGTSFSYVVPANTFSDSDGDTLTYTATGEDDAGLTFDASSRTFSGIPAGGDAGTHEVTVTASDGNGNSVQDTFTITVEDPNLPVVSITGGSGVDEGSPAEFTVNRAESAGSALTVLLSVGEETEDGRNYVSSGNEGNRTVTIPADETSFTFEVATVDDATDEPDGEVRVSIRESASNYTIDSTGNEATVAVNDDDAPNLSIQGSVAIRALTVIEGGSDSYGVALGGRPSGSVSVEISIEGDNDAPDLNLDPSSLTFDTDDWNVPQTVTISAGEDEDKTSESVTLVHAVREGSDEREVRLTLTIRDNDIPPSDVVEAGLVRFGRTVGEQSVSAIRGRLDSPPYIGFGGTFAGHALSGVGCDDDPHAPGCSDVTETATSLPAHDQSLPGDQSPHPESRALEADEIVAGTSFTLTRERGSGNVVTLWGQGSRSGFEGRTGLISLDGDVTGFMLGWDSRERDRLHGFMLSLSSGDVRYDAAARTGSMDLELTALIPYASRTLKNDIRVWGALGFGSGSLTRLEDGVNTVRSGIDWRMAALGAGGDLPPSGALAGAALTWHADLLWTRTGADAVVDGCVTTGLNIHQY